MPQRELATERQMVMQPFGGRHRKTARAEAVARTVREGDLGRLLQIGDQLTQDSSDFVAAQSLGLERLGFTDFLGVSERGFHVLPAMYLKALRAVAQRAEVEQ